MGLFSFVTEAGGKLGGGIYDLLHKEEDLAKPETISPERINELRKNSIQRELTSQLEGAAEKVSVDVSDARVVLTGQVIEQSTCEKATLIAGNQNGISEVDCQIEVEKKEPEAKFYTVKSGDSLSKIAKEFYGSANKYMIIFEANKPMLKDPNVIQPGQELRIPAVD